MTETFIGTVALVGLLIEAVGCYFYMLGGRDGKWKRRFVGSLICATAVWAEALLLGNFQLAMLILYPLLIGAFILGYGSDIPLTKIIKRSIVVAATLVSGIALCILVGGKAWLILPIQVAISFTTVWLAVKNPIQAAAEEIFVSLFLTECLIMYPFVG